MRLIKTILLFLAGAFMVSNVSAQTANASLNILTLNSGQVSIGGVVDIQVTVGNTGPGSILANKVRAQISIPVAIASAQANGLQTGLPPGWTITVNTGGAITICNGSDVIPAGVQRQIFIKVQGDAIGGPSTINGNLLFSSGTSCTTPGTLPGDNTADNTGTTTIQVIAAPACTLSLTASAGTIACNGGTTTLTATPAGANGTVEYSITGGAPFQSSNIFTVNAGTYTVTAREVNIPSCTAIATAVMITQPTILTSTASSTPVSATGASDGTATATPTGGTSPYTYSWNTTPVQTAATATGLAAGSYTVTVTDAGGCTAAASTTVSVPLSITEVYYPQYVQGVGSGIPGDDRKVPYVNRMTISGLAANTTYRYFSRFVTNPLDASDGVGNYIIANQTGNFTRVTSASLSTTGDYGEFTTNGSGAYTGWFIVEPVSATEFLPGTSLYWRIMLNDGAAGSTVAVRVTATNPVTVLGWGTTPTTGTGIRSTAILGLIPRNLVLLYDNAAGTGRPITGTFAESDGTDNSIANGYAPFYANNADGVANTWGSIIPNNLSNGILRICQYALSNGDPVGCQVSPDGTYPAAAGGNLTTANANGGLTELAINGSLISLPVSLVSFTASVLPNSKASLRWRTSSEINFAYFIVESSKDGSRYTEKGRKNAIGNNSNYSLEDILTPGITYYRLRMVDIDRRFRFSNILTVNTDLSVKDLSVYPNPATNNLIVNHGKAKAGATIRIVSVNGSGLSTQEVLQGAVQTTIDVSRLPAGNYLLVYYNEGEKQNVHFGKQ